MVKKDCSVLVCFSFRDRMPEMKRGTMCFAVITCIVPGYQQELNLNKAQR